MKNVIAKFIGRFGAFPGAAILAAALVIFLLPIFPNLNARLNNVVYDAWLRFGAEKPEYLKAVTVDIDEPSLKKVGQLPWPRTILSDLVSILLTQGVAAVGLDIWLTEPDRSSPIAVDDQLEKNFGINLDLSKLPVLTLDNDRYFRNTVAGKPVVLGAYATFSGPEDLPSPMPEPVKIIAEPPDAGDAAARITALIPPLPILAAAAPTGLLNVSLEGDGIVRSIPLLARAKDDYYVALALRALMVAKGVDELKLEKDGNALYLYLKDIEIPLENDGSFRPLYYGPAGTIRGFSAADVLEGKIGREELAGKIVFIGTAAHTIANERSTPFDPVVPEAEIHATIAENILSGHGMRTSAINSPAQICLVVVSALIAAAFFRYFTLPTYAIASAVLVSLYVYVSWLCFQNGVFFSPVGVITALLLTAVMILPFRYRREQADRKKLRRAFARYVSPEVVTRIIGGGEELLKGQQKEVTIMFTDVRDFTSIAEKLTPQMLVSLLNRYFTPMTACVTSRGGTLDKFIGDALMAFWNAPLDVEEHPRKAVQAALDMHGALAKLRPDLLSEFGVDIRMGIGLNCGLAHVGNMGSDDLLDYTCVGENVNLASRLEGVCKRYGVNTVVSASVQKACDTVFPFLPLDKIRVKGSAKPLKIYSPLLEELDPGALKAWRSALNDYFGGVFVGAAENFMRAAENPLLTKACDLFISRCEYLKNFRPKDWDGAWTFKEK